MKLTQWRRAMPNGKTTPNPALAVARGASMFSPEIDALIRTVHLLGGDGAIDAVDNEAWEAYNANNRLLAALERIRDDLTG
jgi:hypothetical protein